MEKLDKIELDNKELHGIPLFFKRIFYNQLTNLEDEMKLFFYDENVQSSEMRESIPTRNICKLTSKD